MRSGSPSDANYRATRDSFRKVPPAGFEPALTV
jgi:hypothetical protein